MSLTGKQVRELQSLYESVYAPKEIKEDIILTEEEFEELLAALNKRPGVLSARWAGPSKNFNNAIKKIYNLLKKKNKLYSKARFVCAISVALPDGSSFEYQGKIEGNLSFPARGKKGFGYDPIFVPKGYAKTFAQISKIKKNQISHRYKAFIQIKKFFKFS